MNRKTILEHDWFPRPLPANVEIGDGSWLHSAYALLHFESRHPMGLRIGRNSGIYVETFFDIGPNGRVEIGDYCTLAGPIISTNGRLTIGDHVLISREVVIADRYDKVPSRAGDDAVRHNEASPDIVIGDCAWLGTRSILLAGARLGIGSIVGAGAVINFDVPDYAIVAGNPARIVGWARPRQTEPVPVVPIVEPQHHAIAR